MGLFLNLKSVFKFDNRGFQAGLRESKRDVQKFSGDIKRMIGGAFTAAFLKRALEDTLNFATRMDLLAGKLRTTTDEVQALDLAMKHFGKDIEAINSAASGLGQSIIEALSNPTGAKANIFEAFGISQEQLQKESPLEILKRISDALTRLDFGEQQTPLVAQLLGEEAAELVPVLVQGLRKLTDEAKEFGAIIDGDIIAKFKETKGTISDVVSAARTGFAGIANFIHKWLVKPIFDAAKFTSIAFGAFIGTFRGRTDLGFRERLDAAGAAMEARLDELHRQKMGHIKAEGEATTARQKAELDVEALLQAEKIANQRKAIAQEEARIKEELARIEFNRMDKEAQMTQLMINRFHILQRMQHAEEGSLDQLRERLELEKNADEMTKLKESGASLRTGSTTSADSLARIGGFIGGAASAASRQNQMLRVVQRIDRKMSDGIRVTDL